MTSGEVPHDIVVHPQLAKAGRQMDIFRTFLPLSAMKWLLRLAPVPQVPGVTVSQIHVGSASGIVKTLLIVPDSITAPNIPASPKPTGAPAVLWIHGGGLVMGTPNLSIPRCARFAKALGAVVALPAYRFAPTHRGPAAAEDCFAVFKWLLSGANGLVDGNNIAVGGESAGGGLAAAVAQMAKDNAMPLRGQILVYPMLDDRSA
ncbi:hypothetical protein HDU93_002539, partial [Gonapodya sp. JEL0774]